MTQCSVDSLLADPVQCQTVPTNAHFGIHEYQHDTSPLSACPEQTMYVLMPHAINHDQRLPCRWRQDGITQSFRIPCNPLLADLLQRAPLVRQAKRLRTSTHSIAETKPFSAEPFDDAPGKSGLAGAHWSGDQDHPLVR